MTEPEHQEPIFAGLISNQEGQPVEMKYLGGEPFYVIPDGDFMRHIEAAQIDNQVIAILREQIDGMEDLVTDGVMKFLGQDDLFTKASINMALKNFEQGFRQSDPTQWKPWLGMMGFRIIVDVHGEVVEVVSPQQEIDGDEF
ncbi:MAG: hypothetical protein JW934_15410 [Anaerolineae bacterium]|nr:hypothetical protein [Anaerolineae bacterium]